MRGPKEDAQSCKFPIFPDMDMSQEKLDKTLGWQLRPFVPQTPLTLELQTLYSASMGSYYYFLEKFMKKELPRVTRIRHTGK